MYRCLNSFSDSYILKSFAQRFEANFMLEIYKCTTTQKYIQSPFQCKFKML